MKQIDTILLVENIDNSKTFYTEILGLEVLHDWGNMVIFKNRLALHQADRLLPEDEAAKFIKAGRQGAGNVIIYLELDSHDIEDFCGRLKNMGVKFLHGIKKLPWQRIFRIMDPDDHIIEIGEKH